MKKYLLIWILSLLPELSFARDEVQLFSQLAAYDLAAANESYEKWTAPTSEEKLLKNTASAYIKLLKGDFEGSKNQLNNVLNKIKTIDQANPLLAIYADRTNGLTHFLNGDFDSAYHYFWPALLLSKETYGTQSTIYFDQLSLIISLFETQGKWTVAEKMLITQLGLSKKIYGKKHHKTIKVVAHLGHLNTLLARFDVAQGYFDECNKLLNSQQINTSMTNAWSLIYQSNFYLTKGNFTVAESLNKEGLKIIWSNTAGYHPLKSFAFLLEAKIYIAMNDLQEAGSKLSDLISYQKQFLGNTHPKFANALLVLADVLMLSGHNEQSQPLIIAGEQIISQNKEHTSYCDLQILKARSLATSDYNQANSYFKDALNLLSARYGNNHYYLAAALSSYAEFLYNNNQLKEALASEEQALEIRTSLFDFYHPDYAASIFSIAKIHLKAKNYNEAATFLKKGAENYIIQYNKYFAFLSEYEKGQFYTRTNAFFDLFYHFALFESPENERQYWINQVFNYRLLTKALLFQSVKDLKEAVHQLNDPALNEAYDLWIRTKENLSKLSKLDQRFTEHGSHQKDSLLALSNELEKKISLKVAISKNAQKESNQLNWQSLASHLANDEMAIEMIRLRDFDLNTGVFTDSIRYVALALNNQMNSGPKAIKMMNGNQMEEKYLLSYRNIIKFKLEDKRSYDVYIAPILDELKGYMRPEIYFSPDGVYNQINLNTLLDTKTGQFFIDKYHLHILSSLRDLIEEQQNFGQAFNEESKFYFFGYPVYEHHPIHGETKKAVKLESLSSDGERSVHFQIKNMIGKGAEITMLPGTLAEVETASDIVEEHVDHEVITGIEATEESVKDLKNPGLVHIATHGFFLSSEEEEIDPYIADDYSEIIMSNTYINPLFNSGIMLAGSAHAYDSLVIQKELDAITHGIEHEDGIMTSYEAMNIDLRGTHLVILSACETGLGKVKSGEGVYGLQRAFQTAGAEAVVISLWKVSDEATKELMTLFYQNYMDGQHARNAFTQAQQNLRSKFKEPYYWGGFCICRHATQNLRSMNK